MSSYSIYRMFVLFHDALVVFKEHHQRDLTIKITGYVQFPATRRPIYKEVETPYY